MLSETVKVEALSTHFIGNRTAEGGVVFSKDRSSINDSLKSYLLTFFLSQIKLEHLHNLYHEADLWLNEVYVYASRIFENPESLHEQSVNLAKHLYEQSNHPKIKGGEFYVAYFKDCIVDGETVDAVGLFKSENKDTFLTVYPAGDGFEIESQQGININKLDKGCLIFNTDKENGYVVAVVDNTNKGAEAHYWIDDFLHVRQRKDEYYNTQNLLTMTKNFAVSESFSPSGADRADLLNKSITFFKEKDSFDIDEFTNEVIEQPEVIESFNRYKADYQRDRDITIEDNFTISDSAVKKQARVFKSVIKLDKNFHIYVHGDRNLIEQGEDERGKFYKVYYKEEQ